MDEITAQHIAKQLRKPEGDDGIRTGKWMNQGNEQMNRDAITALTLSENDNILEIGMGNGLFAGDIVSVHPSIKYTGVDFSETMIDEAKKVNAKWLENGQIDFLFSSASNLPFFEDNFNKVFTVNTIYFWENEVKVLNELHRVLTPGGKLIIAIRPKHQMENYSFTKYGFNMFSKQDVITLLESNGFSTIETIENTEPPFESDGQKHSMENVIVIATRN